MNLLFPVAESFRLRMRDEGPQLVWSAVAEELSGLHVRTLSSISALDVFTLSSFPWTICLPFGILPSLRSTLR